MRKVTNASVNAFLAGQERTFSNTHVNQRKTNELSSTLVMMFGLDTTKRATCMMLHGNMIAFKIDNDLYITNAGWQSNTTKERLNGLPGVSIYQKKGIWYLNEKEWDGEWVKVQEY